MSKPSKHSKESDELSKQLSDAYGRIKETLAASTAEADRRLARLREKLDRPRRNSQRELAAVKP